jgi:hypothetical protein
MKTTWQRLKKLAPEGQGLVEMALALPVLLILFLGLIELAIALRAHLVLVNANREATRFGSRGSFTDEQIAERALVSFADQLPAETLGPKANTQIIITHFHLPEDKAEQATYTTYTTGTLTATSKIDPDVYKLVLKAKNDQFNEELVVPHPDAVIDAHDVVVVEIFYYHNQVLHAPLVEWVFPEPMVLYAWTTMRVGTSRVF